MYIYIYIYIYIYVYVYIHIYTHIILTSAPQYYGVATISRLLKNIRLFCKIQVSFVGLFCKRDPQLLTQRLVCTGGHAHADGYTAQPQEVGDRSRLSATQRTCCQVRQDYSRGRALVRAGRR